MPDERVRGQRQMGQSSDEGEPEGEGGSWDWVVEDMLEIYCYVLVFGRKLPIQNDAIE